MGCTSVKPKNGASVAAQGLNAVTLKLADFMQGPLGASKLMNDMGLMQKKIEFTGTISKIGISKMYKKVSSCQTPFSGS